ncbi:hypothetical protein LBMAG47_13790 [Planctomycetia bacterium]|jgi:hypothetical protein|nr:hypothetical protein LBMAG47_13790 [Planctomycetia bacterium]
MSIADVRIFRIGPGSRTGSPQQPEVAKRAKARNGFALGKQSERHDDAIGPRPRGFSAAAGPDPVGGCVSGQHAAGAGDPAVWAAAHGESLERNRRPRTVPQQVFQALKVARHIAVY